MQQKEHILEGSKPHILHYQQSRYFLGTLEKASVVKLRSQNSFVLAKNTLGKLPYLSLHMSSFTRERIEERDIGIRV